jgi:UDP-3-O-[3-hydroxymyristoyl] glucosamine N-acyltransferase
MIGAGTVLYPYVFVGSQVEVGQNCMIYPNVSLLEKVKIGNRVKIFPGAVLGADGFGLMTRETAGEGSVSEMPQIGNVVIEDDVRIGANSTIDRGTLGETRIGKGSKLDDQVHIGHNSKIGKNCILCGQVGLSGSVVVEDNVVMGGQVGVSDHMKIGKGARIGGQAGVGTDLEGGEEYFGSPALPMKLSLRILRQFKRLPELVERIRALEEVLGKKGKPHD